MRWRSAICARGGDSGIFNCGYGHGFSVRQVIQAVERAAKKPVAVQGIAAPGRRSAHDRLQSRQTERRLGWTPEHDSLDEIVESALAWESRFNTA